MQTVYKAVVALLDREVLATGAAHDLRSALTVLRGGLELSAAGTLDDFEPTIVRLEETARALGSVTAGRVPPQVLDAALDMLAARGRSVREENGRRVEVLEGVVAIGIVKPWGLRLAHAWMDDDGEALAGARVRVAARLVGATCSFASDDDGVHGTLTVRRPTR